MNANDLRDMIRAAARRFDDEDNAAHDLWTWLPSHAAAVADHGDHAACARPSLADIIREATAVIAEGRGCTTRGQRRGCPLCRGRGTSIAVDAVHPDGRVENPRPTTCIACRGTGTVTEE